MRVISLVAALAATASALAVSREVPEELFTVELEPGVTQQVTEDEKWALKRQGVNFMDITEFPELIPTATLKKRAVTFPASVAQSSAITALIPQLSKTNLQTNLQTFSSYYNRYYKSDYGKQSSAWLLQQVQAIITASGAKNVTAKAFTHTFVQSSVIATIPGTTTKTVVIGAHQDSINQASPSTGKAPGADDDGSGTVTILEAFRVLLTDPKIAAGQARNTIEFHWYAAEEGGLLGSQAIFSSYSTAGRDIKAMFQQDMTGYSKGTVDAGAKESVGVITDYVDAGLTAFIKKVITAYCTIPYVETKCGYACSDHASANKAGYPSAFVIESTFENTNQYIHTTSDTIDRVNFDHVLQHARMTLGFSYELAFATSF